MSEASSSVWSRLGDASPESAEHERERPRVLTEPSCRSMERRSRSASWATINCHSKLLQAFEVEAQNRLLFPERRLYAPPPFGDLIREHRVGARQFGGSLSEVAQGVRELGHRPRRGPHIVTQCVSSPSQPVRACSL